MKIEILLLGLALCSASACGGLDPGNASGGGVGGSGAGGTGAQPGEPITYLSVLESAEDYASLSGKGAEVKYLASVDGTTRPEIFGSAECLFQNTALFEYHLFFLRTFPEYAELSPERYTDLVLRRASRVMWGGGLKLLPGAVHPVTGASGVLMYTLYSEPQPSEVLTVSDIVEVDRRLKATVPFAAELLAFMPDGTLQTQIIAPLRDELAAEGVAVLDPNLARPALTAETYSEGEGYGYLRIVTGDERTAVGPRDVLVIDAAPNELGLVAGLVTARAQSLASHLNLRLREKGIPSAATSGIFDNAVILGLEDRLVHLKARAEDVTIEPARLEDAEAFWRSRQPPLGTPRVDLETSAFAPFAEVDASFAPTFGTKAANLGELGRILPDENHVEGFAIPFRAYADFMTETGLSADVDALLADPALATDAAHKQASLEALRDAIRAAEPSAAFREALAAAIYDAYGESGATTRLRFRSSTNAEDLPGVSGAGLYDSKSGCLADDLDGDALGPSLCLTPEDQAYLIDQLAQREAELAAHPERTYLEKILADLEEDLGEEKSAYRAVLRVWASLWNERAFDDREYYGIDHRGTFMGIAVHPTFVAEQFESVIVTNLEPEADEPLYRVVSQLGEVGVVGPSDPTAVTEILTFRRGDSVEPEDVTLVQPSSLVENGESLWSEARLAELAGLLFTVQDHFAENVYPSLAPLALDLEVDITRDGRTVIKQVRPYTP